MLPALVIPIRLGQLVPLVVTFTATAGDMNSGWRGCSLSRAPTRRQCDARRRRGQDPSIKPRRLATRSTQATAPRSPGTVRYDSDRRFGSTLGSRSQTGPSLLG